MDPYIGEIRLFGGYFVPANWQACDGSLLSISTYQALYTLIGTTYGGDGQTTFAVPDLRSRVAIAQGQGPGLSNHTLGEMAGTEQVTLTVQQMPAHTHSLIAQATPGTQSEATNGLFAQPFDGDLLYLNPAGVTPVPANVTLAPDVIQSAGGNGSHVNLMPTLAARYIISLEGIYPSRN